MFIVEVLIYALFACIMSVCAMYAERYARYRYILEDIYDSKYIQYTERGWNKYLTLYVLFFSIIAGIRWNVGSDSLSYLDSFKFCRIQPGDTEYIMGMIIIIVNKLGLHASFGLGIMAFIQIFYITKSLQSYKSILIFLPFVLFGGRYWQDMMGVCRQMMVACIFMYSLKYVIERKVFKFGIIILICYFIHHTSVILSIVYLLYTNKTIMSKRLVLSMILMLCCIIGQFPFLSNFANEIEILM